MKKNEWRGFVRLDFEFEGTEAILVIPDAPNENKNWLLKTEYFDAFQDFEYDMVSKGWHLAFLKNVTRWCLDSDLDKKKRFCEYLSKEFGLYEKCIPVGMSCGGLIASKFAARHPECVSALYLDAPVLNLLSCPAAVGRTDQHNLMDEFVSHTGMTLSELLSYREHPIDKMNILLENDIPVFIVYGDSDTVVPYHENGLILERYYKANGGKIYTVGKPGCAHHPHGLEDRTSLMEFCEKYSK